MSASETLRDLINQIKAEATEEAMVVALEAVDEGTPSDYVEAPAPDGARMLFQQLALVRFQRDALDKAEKQLATAARILIGDAHGIAARGEPLGKKSVTEVTRLNTEVLKGLFPPDQYPQYYVTTPQERLLIDVEFKRHVIEQAAVEAPQTGAIGG